MRWTGEAKRSAKEVARRSRPYARKGLPGKVIFSTTAGDLAALEALACLRPVGRRGARLFRGPV